MRRQQFLSKYFLVIVTDNQRGHEQNKPYWGINTSEIQNPTPVCQYCDATLVRVILVI